MLFKARALENSMFPHRVFCFHVLWPGKAFGFQCRFGFSCALALENMCFALRCVVSLCAGIGKHVIFKVLFCRCKARASENSCCSMSSGVFFGSGFGKHVLFNVMFDCPGLGPWRADVCWAVSLHATCDSEAQRSRNQNLSSTGRNSASETKESSDSE